jgi:hypothetical protein
MSTLFSNAPDRRRAAMQLTLSLLTPPTRPEAAMWQQLTDQQRQDVIDQLSKLVANLATATARQETTDD